MLTYQYKARDKIGKSVQGIMGADSENAVAVKLTQMGYLPITIHPKTAESPQLEKFLERFRKLKFSDLNMFTRQLFTLQKAGLPLLASLHALKDQTANSILKEIIEQISRDIEAGFTLSSALEKHPRVFNVLYVNMVRSGEVSGQLVDILQRLSILGEHEEKLRMQISAAMRYPIIVVVALIIGFMILITTVVPRFTELFSKFTTPLPLPTRILIGINYAVSHFWWLLLMVIVGGVFLFQRWVSTKEGASWRDAAILKVPVFGPLILKLILSRFCRITATLMRSGVPILQILELVAQSVENIVVAKTIDNIKLSVNEGKGMLEPMKMSGIFPPIVLQMVSVGEETGKMDDLLYHVADYYDSQIDYTIQNLVSLIEPILILVLGTAVLFMAMGIFMPMWNMMQLFKK